MSTCQESARKFLSNIIDQSQKDELQIVDITTKNGEISKQLIRFETIIIWEMPIPELWKNLIQNKTGD